MQGYGFFHWLSMRLCIMGVSDPNGAMQTLLTTFMNMIMP